MDTSLTRAAVFAVAFAALYIAHHVGDYWVQTDHQAQHKGDPHRKGTGRGACLRHVLTYVWTQNLFLLVAYLATGLQTPDRWVLLAALAVSGVTHYWADRRWTLEWLARRIPGKANFYRLGTPRPLRIVAVPTDDPDLAEGPHPHWSSLDQPTLGTGAWALDQSFHLAFSVFVPALILAAFA